MTSIKRSLSTIKNAARRIILERARAKLNCLFVLSTGRVGTEAMTHLLALSPDIYAEHEPSPQFLEETLNSFYDESSQKDFGRYYLNSRLISAAHKSQLRRALFRGRVLAETSNRLTYVAHHLSIYLPRSKFIFLHRDPAEVIRSAMRRSYYVNHPWDRYRIEPKPDDPIFQKWGDFSSFQKCCWYYAAVNEFALDFIEKIPVERCFVLSSQALFDAESETVASLFSWIGAREPSSSDVEALMGRKINSQETGVFSSWDDWSDEEKAQMIELCGPVAQRLGYAKYC